MFILGTHSQVEQSTSSFLEFYKVKNRGGLRFPSGLVFAVIYYFLFRFMISKFNLMTPGREKDDEEEDRRQ